MRLAALKRDHSRLGVWAGWAVSVACVLFLVTRTDLTSTLAVLRQATLSGVVVAVALNIVRVTFLIVRWWVLLRSLGACRFRAAMSSLTIGYALNSILPARLGDGARVLGTAQNSGWPLESVAALLVIERLCDALVIFMLVGIAMLFMPGEAAGVLRISTWSPDLGFLVSVVSAVAVVLSLMWLVATRVRPDRSARFKRIWQSVWSTTTGIGSRRLRIVAFLSVATWAMEVLTYAAVFSALGLDVSGTASLSVAALGSAATMVPSAPAAMGTFELAVQFVLSAWDVSADSGLAAAVLVHLVVLGPITLVGLAQLPTWASGFRSS